MEKINLAKDIQASYVSIQEAHLHAFGNQFPVLGIIFLLLTLELAFTGGRNSGVWRSRELDCGRRRPREIAIVEDPDSRIPRLFCRAMNSKAQMDRCHIPVFSTFILSLVLYVCIGKRIN